MNDVNPEPNPSPSTLPTPAMAAGGAVASLVAESERLQMCIHCGFCLDACPTYTRGGDESDSPRGRIYLMRAVAEGRIPPASDAFRVHLDRCLGCRACEPVCPSGVEYGFLLERGRESIARARGIPTLERLLLATFGNPLLNSLSGVVARTIRGTGLARLAVRVLPHRFRRLRMAAAMLEASRPWKGPLFTTTRARERNVKSHDSAPHGSATSPKPVASDHSARIRPAPVDRSQVDADHSQVDAHPSQLDANTLEAQRIVVFEGCVQKTLFGRVNAATRTVMRHNGHEVVPVRGLGCCGALHAHAGDLDGARRLARRNLQALARLTDGVSSAAVDAIMVNAAGCGAMMQDYGRLFEGHPESDLARTVSRLVRDPLVFLGERGVVPAPNLTLRAAWDSPCHLIHGQRAGTAPINAVRAALPDADIVPIPRHDECCGGAGIHALIHDGYTDLILADKLSALKSVDADVVLSANPGCIMQIGAGLQLDRHPQRIIHPIELLSRTSEQSRPQSRQSAYGRNTAPNDV